MEPGRQLSLADKIIDNKDDIGNSWFIDPVTKKVFLKLANEDKTRLLGKSYDNTFYCKRERTKHLLKIANSYGFSINIIEQLNVDFIELYDEHGVFRFPVDVLRQYGDYLHFKEQGFEKQIFLSLGVIEQYQYTPEADARQIALIGESWFKVIGQEFKEDYMIKLGKFLSSRRSVVNVFPERDKMFRAFKKTPFEEVKVVILGQDVYYTKNVADGLAFSSNQPTYTPPSLKKMFERIEEEIHGGLVLDQNPKLDRWAEQGVFLINTLLTVEEGQPKSHAGRGWENFTSKVLLELKKHPHNLVVMLWGADAKSMRSFIDNERHLILEAEHPAAAHRNQREWENHYCFSKCNDYLTTLGYGSIEW